MRAAIASRWLANEEATENVVRLSSGFGNWKRVDRPASLATIRTTRVVPADLNALMLKMESDVSWIAGVICEDDASRDRWRKDSEAAEAKAYGEANERASKLLDAQGQLSWLRKTTQEIEYAQRQTTEAAAAAAQRQAQAEEWVAGTMGRVSHTLHSPRHFLTHHSSPSQDSSATRAPI